MVLLCIHVLNCLPAVLVVPVVNVSAIVVIQGNMGNLHLSTLKDNP